MGIGGGGGRAEAPPPERFGGGGGMESAGSDTASAASDINYMHESLRHYHPEDDEEEGVSMSPRLLCFFCFVFVFSQCFFWYFFVMAWVVLRSTWIAYRKCQVQPVRSFAFQEPKRWWSLYTHPRGLVARLRQNDGDVAGLPARRYACVTGWLLGDGGRVPPLLVTMRLPERSKKRITKLLGFSVGYFLQ